MSSKVLLIYTGGTIGMNRNPQTGALEPFDFEHLLVHVPELEQFDTEIETYQFTPAIDSSDMTPAWDKPMTPHFRLDNNVIIFSLFPGIREDLIRHIIHTPNLKAIVMRTFGSGNAPQSPWLLKALKEGTRNGKVIVNISQCMQGAVEMSRYDTGYHLQEAGVISGYDQTVESAVTKLMFLQSHYPDDPDTIRRLMAQSLRGEITR